MTPFADQELARRFSGSISLSDRAALRAALNARTLIAFVQAQSDSGALRAAAEGDYPLVPFGLSPERASAQETQTIERINP